MKKTLHIIKEKTMQNGTACSLYDERDFNRYIREAMTDTEINLIEAHAEGCGACLRTLYRCQAAMERDKDKEFVESALDLLDELDKAPLRNLLKIIIKASESFLELVSSTGELLRVPAFVSVRGECAAEEKTEPLRIVQDFEAPPISLQASLSRCCQEGVLDLKISIYDREKEEFISGIRVEVSGRESSNSLTTDEEGEVSLRLKREGDYQVRLTSGTERISEIYLTLEMVR